MYKYIGDGILSAIYNKVNDIGKLLRENAKKHAHSMQNLSTAKFDVDLYGDRFDLTVANEIRTEVDRVCYKFNTEDPITGWLCVTDVNAKLVHSDADSQSLHEDDKVATVALLFVANIEIGTFVDRLESAISHWKKYDDISGAGTCISFTCLKDAEPNLTLNNFKNALAAIDSNPEYKGIRVIAYRNILSDMYHDPCSGVFISANRPNGVQHNPVETVYVQLLYPVSTNSDRILVYKTLGEESDE